MDGIIAYFLGALLRPCRTFKDWAEENLDPRMAVILSGIVVGLMTVVDLIKNMFEAVITEEYSRAKERYVTSFEFENLKDIEYFNFIMEHLVVGICILIGLSLVYFLAGMVMRKECSFTRLLAISATSSISFLVIGMVIAPILGLIVEELTLFATAIGGAFSIGTFITLTSWEIDVEDSDYNIFMHIACMCVLMLVGYYLLSSVF